MLAAKSESLPTVYLKPGEIHLTREPAIITTVLGSCICITIYDTHTKFAAICHAVMPSFVDAKNKARGNKNTFQYVDTSIEWMLDQFKGNGIKPRDIEVKLFGGAEMFAENTQGRNSIAVGKKNIEIAFLTLEKNRLKLKAWNVGGNRGRKLIFNTQTGEILSKFVNKTDVGVTFADSRRRR